MRIENFGDGPGQIRDTGSAVASTSLDNALRRLALLADAPFALLLRPRADHRMVTTLARSGLADRFEARRLARIATTVLLAAPRLPAAPPIACVVDGIPLLVQWLNSGEDVAIVLSRRAGAPNFAPALVDRLADQLAWLDDLVELWWQRERGEARVQGLRSALGKSDVGTILLDRNARIIEINTTAERLLRHGQGIVRRGLGVQATDPEDDAALRMAIFATILNDSENGAPRQASDLTLRRPEGRRPLLVAVSQPLAQPRAHLAAHDPAVLLLLVDPEASATSVTQACALYGLTPGETRLAQALCSGMTVAQASAALNLQRESARTYLRRIFAKTGVVRQSGLIQLLINSRLPTSPRRITPKGRSS